MRLLFAILAFTEVCFFAAGSIPLEYRTETYGSIEVVDVNGIEWIEAPDDAASVTIEARGVLDGKIPRRGESDKGWGIEWGDSKGVLYSLMTYCGTGVDDVADGPYIRGVLRANFLDGNISEIADKTVHTPGNLNAGYTIEIKIEAASGATSVSIGSSELLPVYNGILEYGTSSINWKLTSDSNLQVKYLAMETATDLRGRLMTEWNEESLKEKFDKSNDKVEGFWSYLDRETDEKVARLGGRYRLALVSDNEGGYDIIYISGAVVNCDTWKTGMKRGHLSSTIFENHYGLEWYDSEYRLMEPDTHADIEQDAILSLSFPEYRSKIRFAKER